MKKSLKLIGGGIALAVVVTGVAIALVKSDLRLFSPERTDVFEAYRMAIMSETNLDIRHFREHLKGGRADGQDITRYDLTQLLKGIAIEAEHTTNTMQALEIATDHLEEIPDYYGKLETMEKEAKKR